MCFLHIFGAAAWTVWNLVGVHCFLYKLLLQFHTWWIWNAISWRWTFRVTNGRISGKPILGRNCKQVIGELLQWTYIGEALHVKYWRAIARSTYWRCTAGELLENYCQWTYWRGTAGELLESYCKPTFGEALQLRYCKVLASQLLEKHCRQSPERLQCLYWTNISFHLQQGHCRSTLGDILLFKCSSIVQWVLVDPWYL